MTSTDLIIAKGKLNKGQLNGKLVLLTGAGGGIGYEAARALLWLGARVVIAEIDSKLGAEAGKKLAGEFGDGKALFIGTDVSDEKSVDALCRQIETKMGRVDVLFNNATIAPIGAAHKVGVAIWDRSYGVNLRGPVMLLERLLPGMLERKSGIVVFVPSSGAAPYMGAYEVFKTAQVELCNTLAGELEGTGVITFSIGPGIVKTATASKAIEQIAPLYGKSVEEFFKMNEAVLISPEEAGAGFAAAVAMAEQYDGIETSSLQALADAGILTGDTKKTERADLHEARAAELRTAIAPILAVYREQSTGWLSRNVFERQWILRDFKKGTGLSIDNMMHELRKLDTCLAGDELPAQEASSLITGKLRGYYLHQKGMMVSYEKDKLRAEQQAGIIDGWIADIDAFEGQYRDSMK